MIGWKISVNRIINKIKSYIYQVKEKIHKIKCYIWFLYSFCRVFI